MKPHVERNSTDIAQYGRMSMHVEVHDAEPKAKPKRPLPLALLFLGLIAVLFALMIAHLVVRSGIAEWI